MRRFAFVLVSSLGLACSGSDAAADGSGSVPAVTGGASGAGGSSAQGTGGAGKGGGTANGGQSGFPSGGSSGKGTGAGGTTAAGAAGTSAAGTSSAGGPGMGGSAAAGAAGVGGTATAGTSSAGGSSAAGTGGAGGAPWTPYVVPTDCEKHARILTYNPVGDHYLTDAMGANPAACADYYVHEPALAADKTEPRGPAAVDAVHAHGNQFHALAEFHWGGWSAVSGMTWYEKGVEFRNRMLAKGYDPVRDAWAINELPSTTKSDPAVRQNVMDAVKGLFEGAPGSPANGGLVFVIGIGSQTVNFSVYKPALEDWLSDGPFWTAMNQHVRWWSQEAYARPAEVCVASATVAERASHINDFVMHATRLAAVGPSGVGAARAFFDESYVPTQTAFWHSDTYGTTITTLDNMKAHVSTEVYASRAWAATHVAPDWRFAVSWNDQLDGATEADVMDLAKRIADSVHDAYDQGTPAASQACSPSGAYTFCQCGTTGAQFNDAFGPAFDTW